jgi:hypothetical protein
MNFNETDYQSLKLMYDKIDMIDVVENVPVVSVNISASDKKYFVAILCVIEIINELTEGEKILLQKILTYINESMETVPVFVCGKEHPFTFSQLASDWQFEKLLVFGGNRKMLSLNIDIGAGYTPIEINNQTVFFAHALSVLENDTEKKKTLLAMLKSNFITAK